MAADIDYKYWSPLLSEEDATLIKHIAEAFGSFGTYADEATSEGLGEELPQRFDVGLYYLDAGVRGTGNEDSAETAASRTNYFRETYAYGSDILAPGIEVFMNFPGLKDAARGLSGRKLVEPAIVYANLLVPGQELALHTDVPEFRGANRKNAPQWLLVCMLHSGLFDRWRIPILTCVSWWGDVEGGAFTFYPAGASGPRDSVPAGHNSAILVDTDQVFHGVEHVGQRAPDLPTIGKNTRLHYCGDERWALKEGDRQLTSYSWDEIRYSVSWKAYCFSDESDQELWRSGKDDLNLSLILDMLESELRERNVLSGPRPEADEFALLLVSTFIKFPPV